MKCAVNTLYLEADKKKKVSVDVACHIICICQQEECYVCVCVIKNPLLRYLDRYDNYNVTEESIEIKGFNVIEYMAKVIEWIG